MGGYPDAIKRRAERRRHDCYRAYIKSIVERDVPEIADIAGRDQIPRLLEICARLSGRLTNLSELGRAIGRDRKTAGQYLRVLEQIYLVQVVQPWARNELSRIVKTPKLHVGLAERFWWSPAHGGRRGLRVRARHFALPRCSDLTVRPEYRCPHCGRDRPGAAIP